MMGIVEILLKFLKNKRYINDVEKAEKEIKKEHISLKKADDLFIRDAITGVGTILKEDLEQHYYITTVKVGAFGNVLTQAIIQRTDDNAELAVYAHEGFIKQRLADKTLEKLKKVLC